MSCTMISKELPMNVIHSVEKYLIVDGLTLAHARELEQALSKVFGTHDICFMIY